MLLVRHYGHKLHI